jgi:hypothetical protein
LDSSVKESKPLLSSSPTDGAEKSSGITGLEFLRTGTFVISAGFPCQDLSVAGKRTGLSGSQSSLMYALTGWLSRTLSIVGAHGCPNCGANSTPSGTPACAFRCPPLKLALATSAVERSLLPTPTASAYGSCRGGGAGRVGKWRMSLDSLGIRDPEQRERMMGFPPGWTAAMRSVTPFLPKSRSSSLEQFGAPHD